MSEGSSTRSMEGCVTPAGQQRVYVFQPPLIILKKEQDPTSKQFDDDEWIQSLTEAQEITTDVSEESVSYDQQPDDPKKVRPI